MKKIMSALCSQQMNLNVRLVALLVGSAVAYYLFVMRPKPVSNGAGAKVGDSGCEFRPQVELPRLLEPPTKLTAESQTMEFAVNSTTTPCLSARVAPTVTNMESLNLPWDIPMCASVDLPANA